MVWNRFYAALPAGDVSDSFLGFGVPSAAAGVGARNGATIDEERVESLSSGCVIIAGAESVKMTMTRSGAKTMPAGATGAPVHPAHPAHPAHSIFFPATWCVYVFFGKVIMATSRSITDFFNFPVAPAACNDQQAAKPQAGKPRASKPRAAKPRAARPQVTQATHATQARLAGKAAPAQPVGTQATACDDDLARKRKLELEHASALARTAEATAAAEVKAADAKAKLIEAEMARDTAGAEERRNALHIHDARERAKIQSDAIAENARIAAQAEVARVAADAQIESARAAAEAESARAAADAESARASAELESARIAAEIESAKIAAELESARVTAEAESAKAAAKLKSARVAADASAECARITSEAQAETDRLKNEADAEITRAKNEADIRIASRQVDVNEEHLRECRRLGCQLGERRLEVMRELGLRNRSMTYGACLLEPQLEFEVFGTMARPLVRSSDVARLLCAPPMLELGLADLIAAPIDIMSEIELLDLEAGETRVNCMTLHSVYDLTNTLCTRAHVPDSALVASRRAVVSMLPEDTREDLLFSCMKKHDLASEDASAAIDILVERVDGVEDTGVRARVDRVLADADTSARLALTGVERNGVHTSRAMHRYLDAQARTISGKFRKTTPPRADVWDNRFATDDGACACCSKPLSRRSNTWDIGHVVARAHGGTGDPHNVVPVCKECNADMGTTDLQLYGARLNTLSASSSSSGGC